MVPICTFHLWLLGISQSKSEHWRLATLVRRVPAPRAAGCLVHYLLLQKVTNPRFTILNGGFRPGQALAATPDASDDSRVAVLFGEQARGCWQTHSTWIGPSLVGSMAVVWRC
jgi:hypothetical protein